MAETMSRTQAFETCVAWPRILIIKGLRSSEIPLLIQSELCLRAFEFDLYP